MVEVVMEDELDPLARRQIAMYGEIKIRWRGHG